MNTLLVVAVICLAAGIAIFAIVLATLVLYELRGLIR